MRINRSNVHFSIWVPVLTVFTIIILVGFAHVLLTSNLSQIGNAIGLGFMLMFIGTIFWLPSLIVCIILERIFIKKMTTVSQLGVLLFIEVLIPFFAVNISIRANGDVYFYNFLIAMAAQAVRWFYLKNKNRMFEEPIIQLKNETNENQ